MKAISFLIKNPEIFRDKLHPDAPLDNFRKSGNLKGLLADMFPDMGQEEAAQPTPSSSSKNIEDLFNLFKC